MSAVAASKVALLKVMENISARNAILAVSSFRNLLKNSNFATTLSLGGGYWSSYTTKNIKGIILKTKSGNSDNALTIKSVDSFMITSDMQSRNGGGSSWVDWLETHYNSNEGAKIFASSSITYWSYYSSAQMVYIPL